MARNALMPQMRLYDAPAEPNIGALTNPLMQGLQTYRQGMQQQFEGDRALASESRANRGEARADQNLQIQKEKMEVERLGRQAQVVDSLTDPAQRVAAWQRLRQSVPGFDVSFAKYADPNDHMNGPKYLMAEAGNYKSPQERESEKLKNDQIRAQTDMARAHADFYKSRAGAISSQAAPQVSSPDGPPQAVGMDADGTLIPQRQAAPSNAYGYGDGETSFGLPGYQQQGIAPPTMRLGGPRDDIDASMRLDEGQAATRGVQVAQAGVQPPTQMDQARARMYGPSGLTSPDIPGVVTDAGKNRRVDVPATREMQGQRAMNAATPEQQERLRAFRQDQELWTAQYKRQPRAGYYYGPDGRELSLTDKNFKGDKEMQAQALLNMEKIKQASKILLNTSYPVQVVAGQWDIGETGQALADMKQAALGIAYSLSGKTVAVAEMKNFIDAYAPTPFDSNARIKAKVDRLNQFYGALISATRGGQDYDKAYAKAMAVMGVKNPDGTMPGAPSGPLSASDGDRATSRVPDFKDVSTEELLRRLSGGR